MALYRCSSKIASPNYAMFSRVTLPAATLYSCCSVLGLVGLNRISIVRCIAQVRLWLTQVWVWCLVRQIVMHQYPKSALLQSITTGNEPGLHIHSWQPS